MASDNRWSLPPEHMARLVVTYDPEDDLAIQEFISTADSVYVPAMSDLEAIAQLQSDRDAYTEMTLALNTESRLKAFAAKRRHYHGKLKKDLANEALRKALGSPPLNDSMDSSATPSPQEKAADEAERARERQQHGKLGDTLMRLHTSAAEAIDILRGAMEKRTQMVSYLLKQNNARRQLDPEPRWGMFVPPPKDGSIIKEHPIADFYNWLSFRAGWSRPPLPVLHRRCLAALQKLDIKMSTSYLSCDQRFVASLITCPRSRARCCQMVFTSIGH